MRVRGRTWLLATLASGSLLFSVGCSNSTPRSVKTTTPPPVATSTAAATPSSEPSPSTPTPSQTPNLEPVKVTMAFTGDVLPHKPLQKVTRQADGHYRYAHLTHGLKEWVSAATIGVHHQEVPNGKNDRDVQGYPVFAAPPSYLDSVKELGYDTITTASNHTIDRGYEGVQRTIKDAQARGLGVSGTNQDAQQDPIQYYEVEKGNHKVKIAHLSNAYGVNQGDSAPVLKERPWLMQLYNPEYMIELARKARKNGAQVVVLSTHDGLEYQITPSPMQRKAAEKYAKSGVIDFVITHHAHVPEPIEKLPGGVDNQGMWIYWGLGNLLSSMNPSKPYTQLGLVGMVTFTVDGQNKVKVEQAGWQGVILDRSREQIYTLDQFQNGRPQGISLSEGQIKKYRALLEKAVGSQGTKLDTPPAADESVKLKILPRGTRQ